MEAGYEHIADLNVDRPEGVSRFQVTQRNGMRCSAADAFLHPAENGRTWRSLGVLRAHRLRRRPRGRRRARPARGARTVRAEREVILSAGTYQSPVLLMLSGIGPADDLVFGIPVRENLPVGGNLQDHCMVNVNFLTDQPGCSGSSRPRTSRCSRARAAAR